MLISISQYYLSSNEMNFFLILILCFFSLVSSSYLYAATDNSNPNIVEQDPQHDAPDEEEHKAIDWELLYIGDGLYGFSGPYKDNSTLMDNLLFNLTLDSEKLFSLKNNTIFLTYIGMWGGNPNLIIGSPQGADNIEVSYQTSRLYQAWMDQKFFHGRLSVLVGLYDYNSEFDVTDSSLVFIMAPMGTNTEIAFSGENGPSIYPTTSLAGRVKLTPNEHWYLMLAAFDGVPGNPDRPYGTHIDLIKRNGLFWAFENGVNLGADDKKAKLALGSWYYTMTFDEFLGSQKSHSYGLYGLIDLPIYRVAKGSPRGVNFFLRPGIASTLVNPFSPAIGAGLHWQGPFASRADDEAGFAVSYAKSTSGFIAATSPAALLSETLLEITYALKINNHLVLQPSFEWALPVNQSAGQPAQLQSFLGIFRVKASV